MTRRENSLYKLINKYMVEIEHSLRRATSQFVRVEGMRNGFKRRPHSHNSREWSRHPRDPIISQKLGRLNLAIRRESIPWEELVLAQ